MQSKNITSYQISGISFSPLSVVTYQGRPGVAIKVTFPDKTEMDATITREAGLNNYSLVDVSFNEEKHGPFTLQELFLLVSMVSQYAPLTQKVLKHIYETYINS